MGNIAAMIKRQRMILLFITLFCVAGFTAHMSARGASADQIQAKMEHFHQVAPRWVIRGGDPRYLEKQAQQLEQYMKAQRFEEAEVLLDEMIAVVMGVSDTSYTLGEYNQPAPRLPQSVELTLLPPWAEIIFHDKGHIHVMDGNGQRTVQITKENPRQYEHVAVSHDHRYIAANYFSDPAKGGVTSQVVVFDLAQGTEQRLVPDFKMAGNGGVDWDPAGYIYFAGLEQDVVPHPVKREDFIANAAANDIYRAKPDGKPPERITHTKSRGEADVSVSASGQYITYMDVFINPPDDYTEIWMSRTDGSERHLVFKGGKDKILSVHDPELSPDNSKVVFSRVNPDYKNFVDHPAANTAHDIYAVDIDGRNLQRLTAPGPISIIPDWRDDSIIGMKMTDRGDVPFNGAIMVKEDGTGYRHLYPGAQSPKWIP